MSNYIKNFVELASTKLRNDALTIALSAYRAIDTKAVINNSLKLVDNKLNILGKVFDLALYKRIFVIGFGKASCNAALAIEEIMDGHITGGIVIDKSPKDCRVIRVYKGAHPLPNKQNVDISDQIANLAVDAGEDDLVIVLVSGGGSALLCWPLSECDQGNDLYYKFINSNGSIDELNIVRKHISLVKGGGLAKLLFPSTVVSLIFSDVPGDSFQNVASGPTYYDETTVEDAKNILKKYSIENTFNLVETPKDKKYFEKVHNIPLVSNTHAVSAMADTAKSLGYEPIIAGCEIFLDSKEMLNLFEEKIQNKSVVLGGGEVTIKIKEGKGVGGRNEYVGAEAIEEIEDGQVFLSLASDGIDNSSQSAGVLIDVNVKKLIQEKGINVKDYTEKNNEDELFKLLGNQIITGHTGSNVSDLYLLINE